MKIKAKIDRIVNSGNVKANVIQNYLKFPGAMGEASLYQHMGFPSNWSKITAYKK